jgi:hypothetical protein
MARRGSTCSTVAQQLKLPPKQQQQCAVQLHNSSSNASLGWQQSQDVSVHPPQLQLGQTTAMPGFNRQG